jgi:hypothetical protein
VLKRNAVVVSPIRIEESQLLADTVVKAGTETGAGYRSTHESGNIICSFDPSRDLAV